MSPKKVLLFCGAFDPITSGHMLMLELCIKSAFFNEYRVMPSGKRTDKQYKTTDDHRRKMCEIAMNVFKNEDSNLNITFSDYEMNLSEPQDSFYTVKHFNDTESDKEFYFFMGSDILTQMFDWPHSDELIKITRFLVCKREGHDIDQAALGKLQNYKLLDQLLQENGQNSKTSPASSTQVRNELGEGKKCGDLLLHPEVMKYVEDNNLYSSKPDQSTTGQ